MTIDYYVYDFFGTHEGWTKTTAWLAGKGTKKEVKFN